MQKRLRDRAWAEVAVADPACGGRWATNRAHNKGCSGNLEIWHVRCESASGASSTACNAPAFRNFKGAPVVSQSRQSDRAWATVKTRTARCMPSWNEKGAHDKGCSANERIWHVRCEQGGASSRACNYPTFKRFKGAPVRKQTRLRDPAWAAIHTKDTRCVKAAGAAARWSAWKPGRCRGVARRTYFARLLDTQTNNWDAECKRTRLSLNGKRYPRPARCINKGIAGCGAKLR